MKFKQYAKKDNIIRRKTNAKIIKTDKGYQLDYKFEFDFVKGPNNKKNAIVSINDKIAVLDVGQVCIFILEFEDRRPPMRIKVAPDFEHEGCYTAVCLDPKIKDEDI